MKRGAITSETQYNDYADGGIGSPIPGTMIAKLPVMADLNLSEVARIAREAAREQSLPIEVVGVLGGADSRYVEILVNVDGCAREPCQFEMGVFRDLPEARLRQEIGARLRQHVAKDRADRT